MTREQIATRCAEIDAAVRADANAYRAARAARYTPPVLTEAEWHANMERLAADALTWDAPCGEPRTGYRSEVDERGENTRVFTSERGYW